MDPTLATLTEWLPNQRWFTRSADSPRLRLLGGTPLPSDDPGASVRILIVADDTTSVVYQLPVVHRDARAATAGSGWIGPVDDGVLIDGPRDPAFTAALLSAVAPEATAGPSEVLSGEQSNTSIIYRPPSGQPIICKVFRQLDDGVNPDVELQTALSGVSSPHVPATVGALDGSWSDPADPQSTVAGTLAFAQEFLPDVEDAWRVALRAARSGEDFSAAADRLGRATAAVHLDLARLFPTVPADAAARGEVTSIWLQRLSAAIAEVPQLLPYADEIRERYAAASGASWPALQRIHGDYHLGQVLQVPGRGWVLLDFEGEPIRPMHERRRPDLALRDLAGMLRSFDYVAGSLALQRSDSGTADTDDARAWAASSREAFLAGYRSATGVTPLGPLLEALELDKAVYEAIYEARHRPGWLAIPLGAIERLLAL
ncbi:MAG: aminoglycoside phosphotransferase [Microbacterium sp.]